MFKNRNNNNNNNNNKVYTPLSERCSQSRVFIYFIFPTRNVIYMYMYYS